MSVHANFAAAFVKPVHANFAAAFVKPVYTNAAFVKPVYANFAAANVKPVYANAESSVRIRLVRQCVDRRLHQRKAFVQRLLPTFNVAPSGCNIAPQVVHLAPSGYNAAPQVARFVTDLGHPQVHRLECRAYSRLRKCSTFLVRCFNVSVHCLRISLHLRLFIFVLLSFSGFWNPRSSEDINRTRARGKAESAQVYPSDDNDDDEDGLPY
jgi:hypothetical protein